MFFFLVGCSSRMSDDRTGFDKAEYLIPKDAKG